ARAERRARAFLPRLEEEQKRWEKSLLRDATLGEAQQEGLVARFALDGAAGRARFVDGEPVFAMGKIGRAAVLDGTRHLDAGDVANFGFYDRFSVSAWVYARDHHGGTVVSRMKDEPQGEGYAVVLHNGRVGVH